MEEEERAGGEGEVGERAVKKGRGRGADGSLGPSDTSGLYFGHWRIREDRRARRVGS